MGECAKCSHDQRQHYNSSGSCKLCRECRLYEYPSLDQRAQRRDRVLELVQMFRTDPRAEEVAAELSKRSSELTSANDSRRFTYNKLWHLITIALSADEPIYEEAAPAARDIDKGKGSA